jgi:hypothetical protein
LWFTKAYIKKILVKLIFKIFTLENSKREKVQMYRLDPEYVALVYCSGRFI